EFIAACDFTLEPNEGLSGYNHLPVRAAAAIILDRLLGRGA
ncbi:MAG TPA: RNA methyltransferase, partial [Nitrospirota bacterium]|nr:RNA methyltransferase [Nitrospirota bacterium]